MAVANAQITGRLEVVAFRKSFFLRGLESLPRRLVILVHIARQRFIELHPRIVGPQFAGVFEFLHGRLVIAILI